MKNLGVIIGLLSILWLTGCGQKGSLYQSTDAPSPQMEQAKGNKTTE